MLLSALRHQSRSSGGRSASGAARTSRPKRVTAVVAAAVTGLASVAAGVALATPAEAANRVTPGSFTGYGFDQCATQSQSVMDAWLHSSPFWAVGVYIAGDNRACKDPLTNQQHLTSEWVATQLRNGWKILPVTVGPQASCYTNPAKKQRISADPADSYVKAREQAVREARTTVRAAKALGITSGSTLWYDLEHFDITKPRCRESALHFLSTWTRTLHNLGFVSGVYSNASSGIKILDDADLNRPGTFTMPDNVWIARWNGQATVEILDENGDPEYIRPTSWMPHRRVHQYRGDHDETHGGRTVTIDSNYMSLGRGTRAGRAAPSCGVQVDFPRYRSLRRGQRHEQVRAAKCVLRSKGLYAGNLSEYFNLRTQRAVGRYQSSRGLRRTGVLSRGTWTSLLADGATPVTKVGSGGNQVRRVQRALNAATHAGLPVTGIFDAATTRAVRAYQLERSLRRTGVVSVDTWSQLQRGRL